jgi:hypothetical protein
MRVLRTTSAGLALVAAALTAGCSDSATSPSSQPTSAQPGDVRVPGQTGTCGFDHLCPVPGVTGTAGTPAEALVAGARQEIALRAANAAFARAHGKAAFKSGERELEIEVQDVRPGVRVVFYVGTQRLGARTINTLGAARLELRGSAAPASVAGKLVQVKTSAGALVVRGRFPS